MSIENHLEIASRLINYAKELRRKSFTQEIDPDHLDMLETEVMMVLDAVLYHPNIDFAEYIQNKRDELMPLYEENDKNSLIKCKIDVLNDLYDIAKEQE